MLKTFHFTVLIIVTLYIGIFSYPTLANEQKSYGTDNLYLKLIKSVNRADFNMMADTYHADAVLVTASKSTLIESALIRWKKEGEKLQNDGGHATLAFRFNKRIVNEFSSFESGIYRYSTVDKLGKETIYYAHFQDLNIKKNGNWLTMMENQTAKATKEQWMSLPKWN